MGFLAPLGFLGLIGIPILIIIYIIKPKYQERTISSTYIWKLSLKYRKRKLPLQWLKSFLLFVQILIVAILAFLIAQPGLQSSIAIAGKYEKIIILDASVSMQAENSAGESRFDRALKEVDNMISTASDANRVSIVIATDKPFLLVDRESDPNVIKRYLNESAVCGYSTADYTEAVRLATTQLQASLDAKVNNAKITLVSDHDFAQKGYIEVVDVSSKEWNVAVLDAFSTAPDGNPIFIANVRSYNQAQEVTVVCEVHWNYFSTTSEVPVLQTTTVKTNVSLPLEYAADGEQYTQVVFTEEMLKAASPVSRTLRSYVDAKVYLEQGGVALTDSFTIDNEFCIYGGIIEKFKVQLVSDSPLFLYSALNSLGTCVVTMHDTSDALPDDIKNSGYDLYIYDSYYNIPAWPEDGAIWIINPQANNNTLYASLGIKTGAETTGSFGAKITDTTGDALLTNVTETDIFYTPGDEKVFSMTKYTRLSESAGYTYLLSTGAEEDPVMLTNVTDKKIRVIVFPFDLNYSDMPLTLNYLVLIGNMADVCLKKPVDTYLFTVGEEIIINNKPNCTSATVTLNEEEIDGSPFENPTFFTVSNPGSYQLSQTLAAGNPLVTDFFVRIDETESNFAVKGGVLAGDEYEVPEIPIAQSMSNADLEDISIYFAWALLAMLLIEWGLQYREQY